LERADLAVLEFVHRALLRPDNYVPASSTANTAIFRYYASKLVETLGHQPPFLQLDCAFDRRSVSNPTGAIARIDAGYTRLLKTVLIGMLVSAFANVLIFIFTGRLPL
jgi:hypothetical protein